MSKISKVTALFLLTVIAGYLCSCDGDGDGTGPSGPGGTWTILAYMAGNNNLDYSQNINSFVIEDLQEMELVGSDDHLNIVAVISSLKKGGDANVYYVEQVETEVGDNISSTLLESWGQKDMSDPKTLEDFLELAIDQYPADRYMLIMDDHGAGWGGVCSDDNAKDIMKISEMKQAITGASVTGWDNRFDIIVFHACLMASVEVAYGLSDVADYMVACQFTMPMESILNSETWLTEMQNNPTIETEELGKEIATAVKEQADERDRIAHMACLDLSRAMAITAAVGDLGDVLPITTDDPKWAEILDAWNTTHVTEYDDPACVDLRELVKNILNEPTLGEEGSITEIKAQAVLDEINEMVTFTTTNAIGITRGGMNIYMPYQEEQWENEYSDTEFADNNWDAFVLNFINSVKNLIQGTLDINSTPAGAAVAINGEDQGVQTPVTFSLPEGNYQVTLTKTGYQPWAQTVYVQTGTTTTVNATLTPEGTGGFAIQGTIAWNDQRPLTDCYVYLYEEVEGYLEVFGYIDVNEANGTYYGELDGTYTLWIDAWDDVDQNGEFSVGDGWNAVDYDQDSQWPSWGDGIPMSNGNTYNFDITLYEYTGMGGTHGVNRIHHPLGKGPSKEMLKNLTDFSR
jgi:hypothetical protein